MNINRIKVDANYCFENGSLVLNGLRKVNFIFAPNGAGKTTISNALMAQPCEIDERRSWEVAPTDLPIRVFNERYRKKVLGEHVDGIFTIGQRSKEANARIGILQNEMQARRKERDEWRTELEGDGEEGSRVGLREQIRIARVNAGGAVFAAYKKAPKEVYDIVFKGFRNSKLAFLEEARNRFGKKPSEDSRATWEDLVDRARSLEVGEEIQSLIPVVRTSSVVNSTETFQLFSEQQYHGDGHLAGLISHLSNQDWVSEGRKYLPHAGGKCPFCQQDVPDDLERDLSEYFADGFDDAARNAINIYESVHGRVQRLEEELVRVESSIEEAATIERTQYLNSISTIRSSIRTILSAVRDKCAHPLGSVSVEDIRGHVDALNGLTQRANSRISRHNEIVQNVMRERKKLREDGWSLLLSEAEVKAAIGRVNGIERAKLKRISEVCDEISKSEKADESASDEIKKLRDSISNTVDVADRINALLKAMGFSRFRLGVTDEIAGGYRIVRDNGDSAVESLSEGEKSFICFLYFWESLSGSLVAGGRPEDCVVVIDDPISSMDSSTLFAVASFVRDAASDVIAGTNSRVSQLIVLTHNTQFHREAAYVTGNRRDKERRYFRLTKGLDGMTSVLDDGGVCRIKGSYPLLWDGVVSAARNVEQSTIDGIGVFNIVRRIIEGYFKTVGGVKDMPIGKGGSIVDRRVLSMFTIWANAGSHTIMDDIDQTVDVAGVKQFLRLFQKYFDDQGHRSHFDMMVESCGGDDLLKDGQIFARS